MRGKNKFILFSVAVFVMALLMVQISSAETFEFNGTIKDENGNVLNNTNINLTVRNAQGWSVVGYNSTVSNASGWFNLSVSCEGGGGVCSQASNWIYELSIRHFNGTYVDFISKTIPAFPGQMMRMLAGTTFYLTPAGTINITAINSSGERTAFNYQVKDTKLGYPIASEFSTMVSEANIYVPSNRNYSIMIYPNQSMPVSFNWNNFSSVETYNFDTDSEGINLSSYNNTAKTLYKQFNLTMTLVRVSGFLTDAAGAIMGDSINWTNITVIPYLMEPGNMVHASYGSMPYNISAANQMQTDEFNISSGFYNITLPATVEASNILLFATGITNASVYYGGFRNISSTYGTAARQENFSMFGLLGDVDNVTMNRMDGNGRDIFIWTKKQTFNIVNATNSTLSSTTGHIEFEVDYTNYNATQFTWMADIAQSASSASFSIPLINATGFKELNAFVSGGPSGGNGQYAPKRVGKTTVAQILADNNISVKVFNPGAIDTTLSTSSISIALYASNSTCDIPNPPATCLLTASSTMETFNPMRAVMGGGKISFRMGYGGILVHYVNVDLLASGPPDAMFDSVTGNRTSGSSFASIMKFGSSGPNVYDYVLVSIPYNEGPGGLKDNENVTMKIPVLYDENWNVMWNVTMNGSEGAALSGNDSHYSAYSSDWEVLMNGTNCTRRNSDIAIAGDMNSTNPCYIDTVSNKIWVRIPHFSGTGPQVSGYTTTDRYTTLSGIDYLTPTEVNNSYLARNYFFINVTSNLSEFTNLTIRIYNGTTSYLNLTNVSTDPTVFFNYTEVSDGIYYFNVTATNSSNFMNSTEFRMITIDTTLPGINFSQPTENNFSLAMRNNIAVNVSLSDVNFANATIRLFNVSFAQVNYSFSNVSGLNNITVNFTSLSDWDGLYYFNASVCDLANNCNHTATRSVILNVSSLILNSTSASVTTTTSIIHYTSNKTANTTISYGTTTALGTNVTNISYLSSGNFNLSSLSASTVYYYNLTICDRAGNCVVNGTYSFTTSAATTDSSTTTGSGGLASTNPDSYWTSTYSISESQFMGGFSQTLGARGRIKFMLNGTQHAVGVINLTDSSATINVSSTPQQAVFNVGDVKKFELTDDNYYDLKVTLNSISGNKANVTITNISELIPVVSTPAAAPQTVAEKVQEKISEITQKAVDKSWMFWIIVVVVVIIIIAIIVVIKRKLDYISRKKGIK